MLQTLLDETLETLEDCLKTEQDVCYVQTEKGSISWETFKSLSSQIKYQPGLDCNEINENLEIIGTDWWLERLVHDGTEWWGFQTLPKKLPEIESSLEDLLCNN